MKAGILGTGDVGKALAKGFAALGHDVMIGSRTGASDKAAAIVAELGGKGSTGTFAEAAMFGDVVVLATLGSANAEVIALAGAANLTGKPLLDATNPLDFSQGFPPKLLVPAEGSGGQQVQALAPHAKVVKVFNTVGHVLMFKPSLPGGPPTMFLCGDDDKAKAATAELLREFGWEPLDVGGLHASHWLEAMCMVWVSHGIRSGRWGHAFKLLGA